MKTRSTGPTALAAGAALGAAVLLGPAFAQQAMSQDEIRTAFAAADANGDGYLNVDEFVANNVYLFQQTDTNRDRYLIPAEVPQVSPGRFRNADRDGDGRLSLGEAVAGKMIQFFDLDTSHDGTLSLDEVLDYERSLAAASQKR